jgi:hypothetical protein
VTEAEAYVARRAAEGRGLSVKSEWALGELAMESGDAMLALLGAGTKAGQAVAGSRKRFVADMMRALKQFLDSLPEEERLQVEALLDDSLPKVAADEELERMETAFLAAEFPGLIGE